MSRLLFYGSLVTISVRNSPYLLQEQKAATKVHFVLVFFSIQTLPAYFRLIHTPSFLSSLLYLLRPTRLNPPHALGGSMCWAPPFPFSNSFPNIDLTDFLEADPS